MTYTRPRKPKYLHTEAPTAPKRTGAAGAITLRLDARTTVTVKDQAAVARWREQYPNLQIIEQPHHHDPS